MTTASPGKGNILIVDDSAENLRFLMTILSEQGHQVRAAISGELALDTISKEAPDLVILDVRMPGMDGLEVCRRLKEEDRYRDIPVIFVSALAEMEGKVRALSLGGVDYITRPFHIEEVITRVETHLSLAFLRKELEKAAATLERKVEERTADLRRVNEQLRGEIDERRRAEQALEQMGVQLRERLEEIERLKLQLEAESAYLQEEIKLEHNFEDIIGRSDALTYVLYRVQQVAPTDSTVLILGETGVGKELIARAIHQNSPRRLRPMVKVNCAALPANLIESELFGHEKGAFTGAGARKPGRFELADKTTLFLDEIGELPLDLQAKLLRVLEDGEFERLGGAQTIRANVRIISATNRHLEKEMQAGRFRSDLWYRLNVYPITVPPLRDRTEDIPLLVRRFVDQYSKQLGKSIQKIPAKTVDILQRYAWPGNVRELRHVIERAVISNTSQTLQLADSLVTAPVADVPEMPINKTLEEIERDHILKILGKTGWQIEGTAGAARILDIHPATLRSRMKKLGIQKPWINGGCAP